MTTFAPPSTSVYRPHRHQGCGEDDCDVASIEDIDVYCRSHDRFLPLAGADLGRLRPALAFAWRAAICAAFLITASTGSAYPVFLAVVALGGAVVTLPLRRFGALAAYAVAGWAVACGGALLLHVWGSGQARLMWTALLFATALAWLAQFTQATSHREEPGPTAWLVASSFAVAPAALAIWLGSWLPGAREFIALGAWLSTALLTIGAGAAVLALLIAACGAIARTADQTLPYTAGPFARPTRPRMVPAPRRARRRRLEGARQLPDRIGRAVLAFAETTAFAAHATAVMIGNTLLRAWYWAKVGFFWLVNWIWCWAHALANIVARAARAGVIAAREATRMILVPVAALAAAAWGAFEFAQYTTTYLMDGSMLALVAVLGVGAVTVVALHTTWIALCGRRMRLAARSAGHALSVSGANGLLLIAVGGWTIGLFGTFHHGPIRVGWVTLAATLVLATTSVWTYLRHRGQQPILPVRP